jgi:hypothetical protein
MRLNEIAAFPPPRRETIMTVSTTNRMLLAGLLGAGLLAASPAFAQDPPTKPDPAPVPSVLPPATPTPAPAASPYAPRPAEALRREQNAHHVRYQVQLLEGVLERAVTHAADMLTRRIRTLSPDVVMLTGAPRARGMILDGYGALFTLDVPSMSPSINWSLALLQSRRYMGLESALEELRRMAQAQGDQKLRADAERALRTIEQQVGVSGRGRQAAAPSQNSRLAETVSATGATASMAGPDVEVPEPPAAVSNPSQAPDQGFTGDPNEAYEREVKHALVDVMLDHSAQLPLAESEWLTVAARDADYAMVPLGGAAVTIILRISGADLAAYRAGRLSRDDARERVTLSEF